MKKLFGVMATIALLTSAVASAQPEGSRSQNRDQHQTDRSNAHSPWTTAQGPTAPSPAAPLCKAERAKRCGLQPDLADPRRYPNNGLHRGWGQDRGNAWRWRKGDRMGYNDWYYAPRVDYRQHRLRRPPYGYQWRRYEDRYGLVAVSTGLILSVILSSGR